MIERQRLSAHYLHRIEANNVPSGTNPAKSSHDPFCAMFAGRGAQRICMSVSALSAFLCGFSMNDDLNADVGEVSPATAIIGTGASAS
ncbi:hypothetical protein KCP70_19920 [Salmonella enterica subsp. enterica]|nr:hypothetical protein KCP70_19920 [Salmonella enterica subsp. enterica]